MNPLEPWRKQLRDDPVRTVAGVLEGWLDRGSWQRTEPVDFLLDLADADTEMSETAAAALLEWTREKLTWDDLRRLRYGERAHAGQIADALATLQRLKAPCADSQLAENHPWFEARIRPMRFDERLDLPRLFWLTTAFLQPDERFLTRWMDMCGQAACLALGWREWLRVGLTGLRRLQSSSLPAEQQALAGLLLFEYKIKQPHPKEATEFAARQFSVLRELYPRGPQYWTSVLAEVRGRLPEQWESPTWMLADAHQIRPRRRSVAPPLQDVLHMAERIRNESVTKELWRSVAVLFRQRLEHARHTGENEYLVKTVSNLGGDLLLRNPKQDILRSLLAWIRTAMDWDVGNAYLWVRLADCRRSMGQTNAAEATLWESMRRFPDDEVIRGVLAELLWGKGEHEQATKLLDEALRRFPGNEVCRNLSTKYEESDTSLASVRPNDLLSQEGTADSLDDDPFVPWATERAQLVRMVHGIGKLEDVHTALLEAARTGGAAELAEAALRLLFPDEALSLADSLQVRPDSLALRLIRAGQNPDEVARLAEMAPEAATVLHNLYRTDADPLTWNIRFRDAIFACADLKPPPAWPSAPT